MTTSSIPLSDVISLFIVGSLLGRRDRISLGHDFIRLAQSLLKRPDLNAKESTGDVLSVVGDAMTYLEPLQSANEIRVEGEIASKASGNAVGQCLCRLQYVLTLFHAGIGLNQIKRHIAKAISLFKQHKMPHLILTALLMERSICTLATCDETEADRANKAVATIQEKNGEHIQV